MGQWPQARRHRTALLATLCAAVGVVGYGLLHRYEDRVRRADLLGTAPTGERVRWESGALNLLLLGSDSRLGEPDQEEYPGQRSDAVMIVHLNAERDQATVVSIPKDSYVNIPAHGEHWSGGMNELNAAFTFGGVPLAAATVTELTGLPLHGVVVVNFASVRNLVDALGGISIRVPCQVVSTDTGRIWPAGCHQLDGSAADDFVRQRHNVPGGDFGRIHHQQLVLSALLERVGTHNLLGNPLLLDRLLTTAAESLVVDRHLDLRKLALAARKIRAADVRYLTVPYTNPGLATPAGAAVELDPVAAQALFAAIGEDRVTQWLAEDSQRPGV